MAKKVLKAKLNSTDIRRLISDLQTYRDGLDEKADELSMAVAKRGSEVANEALGGSEYASYISVTPQSTSKGSAIILAQNTGYVERKWKNKEGEHSAIVNPILMAEFGSGSKAVSPKTPELVPYGGRGTFPNQTHAGQPVWYWKDLNDEMHISSGEKPSRPMHKAMLGIHKSKLKPIAKEVFNK